jgi:hypothetical protein
MESKTLDEILNYLCESIGGDWLLTGGSLVRLSFDASRGTEDVDLVRLRHPTLSDEAARNELFRWLIARGLGPEWVNTAVEPFVKEVAGWERELVLLRQGSVGALFRPNLTFFAYLKLRRGTSIDLEDVRKAVRKCPEGFDEAKFRGWASEELWARFQGERINLGI